MGLRRRLLAPVAVVVVVVVLGACGVPDSASSAATSTTSTGESNGATRPSAGTPTQVTRSHLEGHVYSEPWARPVTIDGSLRQGPERFCGGLLHTDIGFTLLGDGDEVTEIVVCAVAPGALPGDGTWAVVSEHRVPDTELPALATLLREPSYTEPQPSTSWCEQFEVVVPMFTVTTADGGRLQGAVPSDGCHPLESAVRILTGTITDQPALDRWRTEQIQDELSVTTECARQESTRGEPAVDPGEPVVEELQPRLEGLRQSVRSAAGASVCLYGPTGPVHIYGLDEPENISDPVLRSAAGFIGADLRDRLLDGITVTAPADRADCPLTQPWPPGPDDATFLRVSGVFTSSTGDREIGVPLLYVEVGRCGRVIDGQYEPAGWADSAVVTEIRSRLG